MKNDCVVVIDPGHGGVDNRGCSMGDIDEAEWCLGVGLRLRNSLLAIPGIKPYITREYDIGMSQKGRGKVSGYVEADLVISIHSNSYKNDSLKGCMTFHWPGNNLAASIGEVIQFASPRELQREIIISTQTTKGVEWLKNARAICSTHQAPTVLVEAGFASHPSDLKYMLSSIGKDNIVRAIVAAILEHKERILQNGK